MSTARKFELAPDEVYIQEALKDGRATIQEVSMKALGRPDVAFQARVKHIDMDHVHRLSLIHDQEGRLSPIVVFRAVLGAIVRWIMADGFHRHEVYRRKGERAIRAYVVDVPMESIEHEARLFAAMCNQVTLLARTEQDKRRAVEMLLADPECFEWSTKRIGDKCGVSPGFVKTLRDQFSIKTGIKIPGITVSANGQRRATRKSSTTGKPSVRERKKDGQFYADIAGNHVYVGNNRADAEARAEKLLSEWRAKRISLRRQAISEWLLARGILTESRTLNFGGRANFGADKSATSFIVGLPERDTKEVLVVATGLRLLRLAYGNQSDRLIAVCYPDDFPVNLLDLVRQDGIEFLTPDELVESLKGAEGS